MYIVSFQDFCNIIMFVLSKKNVISYSRAFNNLCYKKKVQDENPKTSFLDMKNSKKTHKIQDFLPKKFSRVI